MEGLQTTTTIDTVYDCTTDALILLATLQVKYLKHTTRNQPTPSSLITNNTQNKKQKRVDSSLHLSENTITSLLHIATTNMKPSQMITKSTHNPWTSIAWFEATEANQLDKMETESNKTVEANPTDIDPSCPLCSQANTKHPRPGY
ncbi:7898_t:CDS:2 [Gigaspora margarita]|uniref:7898_t:CDS:1 n=1 Tax=Gigaspora margarita TaxID=4874 RepID=A0ABN7V2P5_GIGMA|nr:7898_t:CDS:2 [Gigaspora margarita]